MKIKLVKALWGMNGGLDEIFSRISEAGYDGIEAPVPEPDKRERFQQLLKEYQLDYIAQVFSQPADHIKSFLEQVEIARNFNPLLIVSHSAKDDMPFDQQVIFFKEALAWEKQAGTIVAHETHRGRAMFTPWNTAALLKELPEINITADFSHWCNVCESTLENQQHNLEIAFNHAVHIHARVGFSQGPQVPHPGAPEYKYELNMHESWWDSIIEHRKAKNVPFLTVTPEFGPIPYMNALPYTNQPVTDLWEVNYWMAKRFQERFL